MAKTREIVVVGCGRLGSLLASYLSHAGHNVVIVDLRQSAFSQLSAEFSGFTVVGDATEMAILEQSRIHQADCLLAVTDQDNINLMVTQVARTMFDVSTVIARVYDPGREAIYQEFGIDTINPTRLSVYALLEILHQKHLITP
ncbi:MAG: Trk system potassium uptake protein TrkA [Cyanobacteriota bacterium]